MYKRFAGILILCALLAAAVMAPAGAGGKGQGQQGVKIEVKIKISTQFANFPLPFAAELVARNKQKAAKEWTEYRVVGFSVGTLTVFYRSNMPGHGWKLGHYKDNTWVWRRGNRSISVVLVQVRTLCLIQVRETRR